MAANVKRIVEIFCEIIKICFYSNKIELDIIFSSNVSIRPKAKLKFDYSKLNSQIENIQRV